MLKNATKAVERGLMIEVAGEVRITDAGLFAIAGAMAHDPDAENREHCLAGVKSVMDAAVAGGFPQEVIAAVLWAFSEGIDPCDDSDDSRALATMCRKVSSCTGPGRMGVLLERLAMH